MRKKYICLLAVIPGIMTLAAARTHIFQNSRQNLQAPAPVSDTTFVLNINTENVTSISFQIGSTLSSFLKKGDTWIMKEDSHFPVNPDAIHQILSCLSPLTPVRTLTNTADLSEYGLTTPQNTVTVTCEDGTEITIETGAAAQVTGDTYVMINHDSSVIYTVSNELLTSISDNLYDYAVSEALPRLTPPNISSVTVRLDSTFFTLEQNGNEWMISSSNEDTCTVSQTKAYSALTLMKNLTYQSYLEYHCISPEQYGLNPPAATIEITLRSGNELAFSIGAADSSGNYYVQKNDSAEVHTFPKETVDALLGWSSDSFLETAAPSDITQAEPPQ